MRASILAMSAFSVLISAGSASAAMAPKEIQATLFNGQPIIATTPGRTRYKLIFTPDGKITREKVSKPGPKDEGTWKLSGDGFCTAWKGAGMNCFRLVAGEKQWSVMVGTTTIGIWTRE